MSSPPSDDQGALFERAEQFRPWQKRSEYPPGLYDGRPPAEPKDEAGTSRAAADSVAGSARSLQARIKRAIVASGEYGMTDDEVEAALGLRHQTASARRRELAQLGHIHDSGRRRPTRSGRKATVWVAKQSGRAGG